LAQALKRFDFKNPNYEAVWKQRSARLQFIRAQPPEYLEDLRAFYKRDGNGIAAFINDWGVTFDPRNPEVERPALMPFTLFQKQWDWVVFTHDQWKARKPSLTEKSRECGLSWLAVGFGCTVGMLYEGVVIGYGSRTIDYVDKIGEPKSLFWKARLFMKEVPPEFSGGWDIRRHGPHKRIYFPATGSSLTGESGDNIGRGDRTSVYFTDEEAFLERPASVEASLSQTTNARHSISTPNGMGNPFQIKAFGGKIAKFTFHWRDDPRKDEAWYAKQVEELDPVVVAQEIDINYAASVDGVLIPQQWVTAATNAIDKLRAKGVKLKATGELSAGLDVADEGRDLNALCMAKGIQILAVPEWSGKDSDIFETVERAFDLCDQFECKDLRFDADGLGAGVRGDARIINEARKKEGLIQIAVSPFRGSNKVFEPMKEDERGRKNEDFFANANAQAAWGLRARFRNTYRWVVEGIECNPDDLISLNPEMPNFTKLCSELVQPTFSTNNVGKILIDKKPDGSRSPNLFDAVKIRYARTRAARLAISHEAMAKAALARPARLNINMSNFFRRTR
jgi:phage terminase large subunit